jgi:ABC-type transporter MlaC component
VRLVGVPPESMGKFGGETDNWTWPRHTADFSLFRVYTNLDGRAAEYSKENIPMVPKWFFPVSTAGIKEGDFAMIIGFPGSTDRFLTSYGVKMAIEEKGPTIVNAREVKLNSWREFRTADPVVDLQYAAKYAGISNYWKYYIGQKQQLINNDVVARKKKIEDDFQTWVTKNNKKEYLNVIADIKSAHEELTKYEKISNLYSQAVFSASELFSLTGGFKPFYELVDKKENDTLTPAEQRQLQTRADALQTRLTEFFKNYNLAVDMATTAKMLEHFYNETKPEQRPQFFNEFVAEKKNNFKALTEDLYDNTIFSAQSMLEYDLKTHNNSTAGGDMIYHWYVSFSDFYNTMIEPLTEHREKLARANRLFVRGLLEMNPDKLFAPNANSQIRYTYGKVGGYPIKDGLTADFFTTLEGVMVKEDPTSREFIVDKKLKDLFNNKDYGQYAEDGRIRVNFLTDHDITGGNSGSPVINAKGELIGCAFDGNWEAMSGDIFFEPALQRCINVDIRYILFIIEKFGNAKNIIEELTIVNK